MKKNSLVFRTVRAIILITVLLSQQILPAIIYAQTTDNNEAVVTTPTPTATPTTTPTEEKTSTDNKEIIIPKADNQLKIEDLSIETTSATLSGVELTGKLQNFSNIVINKEYVYALNPSVTIKFLSLPIGSNDFSIEEVSTKVGAKTYTGYDIKSDMQNGTFNYKLTLPNTLGQQAELQYSEDGKTFVAAQNEQLTTNTISIQADHFTTFVVVLPVNLAACISTYTPAVCFTDIQSAINAAVDGDIITIESGTYFPTSTINVNKEVTIQGAGEALTIIDASTMPASSYGMNITVNNVTLKDFTLQNAKSYGLKIAGISPVGISNIDIDNVTVKNSARSNIDFNGVDNITLTNITATGAVFGVGIAVTDGINGTFTNITTSGNAWAGMAFYTSTYFPPAGVANMAISGSNSFSEAIAYYTEGSSFTNITYSPSDDLFAYSPTPTITLYAMKVTTPTNLGWNVASASSTPNETPIDKACAVTPVYVNENSVAMNWTTVSGTNIKYQREVTFPSGTISYFYNTLNYTPFSSFGGGAGTQGQWGTRVRAFEDINSNGIIDATENTSNWSNACSIVLDTTAPSVPTNGAPTATIIPTNNFDFTWDASSDTYSPITYLFQSSLNSNQTTPGILDTGLWNSGVLPSNMIHSAGAPDGIWYWQVRAVDAAGNMSAWSSVWNVTLDTTKPLITFANNVETGPTQTDTINITVVDANPDLTTYQYAYTDGTCDATVTFTNALTSGVDWTESTEAHNGQYICAKAADSVGNTSYSVSAKPLNIDVTAPTITFSGFKDQSSATYNASQLTKACGSYNNTGFISWEWLLSNTEASPVTYTYKILSGPTATGYTATTTNTHYNGHIPMQGTYLVSVFGTDGVGNVGAAVQCTVIYDATAPIATVSVNRPLLFDAQRRIIVTATYSEAMDTTVNPNIAFSATTGAWSIFTAGNWVDNTHYTIEYRITDANEETVLVSVNTNGAKDLAGNTEGVAIPATFAIDTKNPITSWTTPLNNGHIRGTVTLSALATDAMSGMDYVRFRYKPAGSPDSAYITINQTTIIPFVYLWNTTSITDGAYQLRLRGQDNATNYTLQHIDVVIDNTAPVLTLPANISEEAVSASGNVVTFSATANDAIDGVLPVSCTPNTGATFPIGTTTVNCTTTDLAGNTASGSFTVTIQDTTAPVLTLPSNITQEAVSLTGNNVTYLASANDNIDGTIAISCLPISGALFPIGTTTVNCSATDAAGNTTSGSFTITIQDTTLPIITVPANITREANIPAGRVVTYSASANDNLDGTIPVTCTPVSGSTFPITTTTVSCSATDSHGNTGTRSFTITIRDTTPPTITTPGLFVFAEATGPTGAVVTYTVTANDIVDGPITPICTPISGSTFALGSTTVNCSASDSHGNTSNRNFRIIVVDTTPPTFAATPDLLGQATGPSGAIMNYTVTATDIVDGSVTPTCVPTSGSTFRIGTTTVLCMVRDSHFNFAFRTFRVTVIDTTPPIVTVPTDQTIYASNDLGSVATFIATATDLVDGSITPICTPASGSTFLLGTTTVTCTATDVRHNTGSASFNITVIDNVNPTVDLAFPTIGPAGTSFQAVFSENVNQSEAENPANYFLNNWPTAGGSGDLVGDATISYNSTTYTATITFTDPNWYVSPEQQWGVQNIHDVTGNLMTTTPYTEYSTPMVAPVTTDSGTDNNWHHNFTVTFTCSDVAGSGCYKTYYKVNGGSATEGNSVTLTTDGTYVVTYYSQDNAGNTEEEKSTEFSVKIDSTSPILTLPANITEEAVSASGNVVNFTATATDIIDGVLPTVCTPNTGATFPIGTTTVNCSAVDLTGNTTSGSFTITIRDTISPTITVPANITVRAGNNAGSIVSFIVTALDNIDSAVAPSCTPASGSLFGIGNTGVVCNVTDAHGNTNTASFTVTVLPPIVVAQEAPTVTTTPTVTPTSGEVAGENTTGILGLMDQKCDSKYDASGYVYIDKNNNGSKDSDESIAANVEVIVYLENVKQSDGSVKNVDITTVKSDSTGLWKANLCAGSYKLKVSANTLPSNTKLAKDNIDLTVKSSTSNDNLNLALVESTAGFNWWLLILLAAIVGVIGFVYRQRQNSKDQLTYK
jgi:hypothetical protein